MKRSFFIKWIKTKYSNLNIRAVISLKYSIGNILVGNTRDNKKTILKLSCLLLFDLLTPFVMFDVHHSLSAYTSYLVLFSSCLRYHDIAGLPRQHGSKESACQYRTPRSHRIDPWVGKTSWRRAWQPSPEFLPGESHGQRGLAGLQSMGLQRVRQD